MSTPKDWPTGRKNSQISVTISGGRPTFPGTLANKPKQKRPVFQPAGTMGSTTEVTVSTPKTYQTAKKNTAFARTACHKGWQTSQAKASRLYNLLVPWEVPRKLPLAPQRLTKQRRKTPHLLAACHKGADTTVKFLRFARRLHLTEQPRGRIFNLFPSKPFSILPHSSLCTSV